MILQSRLNGRFQESQTVSRIRTGPNQSIRYYHSNSVKQVEPTTSSRYDSNNRREANRSSNFSASRAERHEGQGEIVVRKNASPKHPRARHTKAHSILDLIASKSPPMRTVNRSPHHEPTFYLKELQSARNHANHSAHNHKTTGMRSQRTNNESELRRVNQTQIVPIAHLDSKQLNHFAQTPSKRDDFQLQHKLFGPRRTRPKVNAKAQGLEQKLRNLLTAHKASDEKGERADETRDTREQKRPELRVATQPAEERIQYSQRLKWKSYLFDLVGYSYVKELGRGGYARVILCRHDDSNQYYAVKIYDKLLLESRSKISNIKRELKIMAAVSDHHNISSLKESIENKTTTFIVMEYCQGYSLFSQIKGSSIHRLSEQRAKGLFRQIVEAVAHLKRNRIAHRDIKAENVLVNGPTVKLIDFGFSVFCQPHELIETFCGTPTYMSPEIVAREPYDPFKSDVWSLGVLLYLMLHGVYPFFSQDETSLFNRIRKGRYKVGDFISPQAKELLRWMLIVQPDQRISVEDIPRLGWC